MNNTLAFASFLEKWGDQYASLKNTLTKLKEHQDILDKFDIGEIYSADELDIWVEDWLWLHSKFDHPLDIMFFKPYWVPVQRHSYEYMVDLSAGTFDIFETNYISIKPYAWAHGYKFPTLTILNATPENFNLTAELHFMIKERTQFDFVSEFAKNRDSAAYRGDLEVEPVTFEEVFDTSIELPEDDLIITKPPIEIREGLIRITDVNVMAVCLLPFETKLESVLDVHDFLGAREDKRIKCIADLVYYLRSHGYKGINEFRACIPDTNTEIYYERFFIEIANPSQYLKDRFTLTFDELQNN